jgi:O-antigen ligase
MNQCRRVPWEALLLGLATASIPLWPDLVMLSSVTPPGVSILPLPVVAGDLLLCILVSAAISIKLAREGRSSPPALAGPIAAYAGSWILASVLGFDIATGLLTGLAVCMAAAFHLGICAWYDRPFVARTVYTTFFLTGTIASLLGIAMALLKRPPMLYTLVHGRAVSTFIVPGEFAAYLLLLMSTSLGVVLTVRSKLLLRLGIAALLSGSVALGMTYSRAGWLGAAAGTAFFLYVQCRQTGKSRIFAALVGAAPIVVLLALTKYLFHGHHNPSEDFVRLPIWLAGLRTIELFPLTGTGPGSFRHVYPLLRPRAGEPGAFHVHNVLLTAFAETGMIGLATLCALWLRFIGTLRDRLREAKPAHRTLATAIATGFVATWAQGMLDFVQIVVLGCWLPFMALALVTVEQGIPDS